MENPRIVITANRKDWGTIHESLEPVIDVSDWRRLDVHFKEFGPRDEQRISLTIQGDIRPDIKEAISYAVAQAGMGSSAE